MRKQFMLASRRHNPWMVLGLLPYLFFCFAGGLHNHAPDGFSAQRDSSAVCGVQEAPGHTTPPAVSSQQADKHAECLICLWAAQSTASLNAPDTSPHYSSSEAAEPEPAAAVYCSLASTRHNRGPPLS